MFQLLPNPFYSRYIILGGSMSLQRKSEIDSPDSHPTVDEVKASADRGEEDEFAEASESLIRALEKAGITRSALEATLPEARRLMFARRYPQLASELDHDTGNDK
jgi:hypothetical protein